MGNFWLTVSNLAVYVVVFLLAHFDRCILTAYFLANATYHKADSKSNVESQLFMHQSIV